MQNIILLNLDENIKLVEEQESSRFIRTILESMGVDLSELWTDDKLDIQQKIKIREILAQYQIKIIAAPSGNISIYLDNELIAEWHKPECIVRFDNDEIDIKKKFYVEMRTNYTSVFENGGLEANK